MPSVVDKKTGQSYVVTDEVAGRMLRTGNYDLAKGERIAAVSEGGAHVSVGERSFGKNAALHAQTEGEAAEQLRQQRLEEEYGGVLGGAKALGEGFASGLTFHLADPFLDSEGRRYRQENMGGLTFAGELGGMLAPVILTGGAAAPEAAAEVAARGVLEAGGEVAARGFAKRAVGEALGYTPAGMVAKGGAAISRATGGGVRGAAAAGAFEGAAQGAGDYLGQVATSDKELSAEGFVGATTSGALYGGIGGGAFGAAEKGFVRARELFPKLAGRAGRRGAQVAEAEAAAATEKALQAGDDLYDKAKARLTELKVQRAETDVTAKKKIADIRVAEAEQRLATRQAKDEIALARAKAGRARKPASPKTTQLPRGFGRGVHVAEDAPIYKGLPGPDEIDEAALYVAHPRDFADRVEFPMGTSGDEVRLSKVRGGLEEGKDLPPIEITMRKDGTMEIADGRHRLTAAAQLDQPVAIRLSRAYEPELGDQVASTVADEMATEVADDAARTVSAADIDRLERAMFDFAERQSAAREWIARTRQTAAGGRAGIHDLPVTEGVEHARVARTGAFHDAEGKVISREEFMAARGDERVIWDRPQLASADDTLEVYEDYNRLVRKAALETEEDARTALLKEAADLELQAFDASPKAHRDAVLGARARLGLDAEGMARKRMEREIETLGSMKRPEDAVYYATGEGARPVSPRMRASKADEGIADFDRAARGMATGGPGLDDWAQRALGVQEIGSIPPPPPNGRLVADVDNGASVLGEYERAHAELVDAAGDAAPAEARAIADEYKGAVDEVSAKSTKRQAQVADELAAPPTETKKGKGILATLADAGAALEVLNTLGIPGMPDIRHLPVIGPLLSLYLKARAARAVFSRLGGKLPATAEAKVARAASQTRDRVASAVDRMLEVGAKGARRAVPAAGSMTALAASLWNDQTSRAQPKDVSEAARHRADELAAATATPDLVRVHVRRALRGAADPDLVHAVEEMQLRKLAYLARYAPKAPPPSLLGGRDWKPSRVEAERFARRVRAAEQPVTVFEDMVDGTVTPEAAQTLREVYPRLYQEAQERLMERAAELTAALPLAQVARLSVLFDAPLAPAFRPDSIAQIQTAHGPGIAPAPTQMPGAMPSGAAPDLGSLFFAPADRRSMR